MRPNRRQSGFTLTEMTVVIGIIAVLAVFAAPAARRLFESFETEGGVRVMIGSALASARAIAVKEQRYAGIRFQLDDPLNPLDASQYIVFIVQDTDATGMAYGFRAVEGTEPIKLPETYRVTDFTVVPDRNVTNPAAPNVQIRLDDPVSGGDSRVDTKAELVDTTTFSIVFSPNGKLVMHGVRVRNRNGRTDDLSRDDIFNTAYNVEVAKIAKLYQDDYFGKYGKPDYGLGPEPSRAAFFIYDREKFAQAFLAGHAYSQYLYRLIPDAVYINPYTGTLVSSD